jgi:hypothetical protein
MWDILDSSSTVPPFCSRSSTDAATSRVGTLSHWRLVVRIADDQIAYLADSICIVWVCPDDASVQRALLAVEVNADPALAFV